MCARPFPKVANAETLTEFVSEAMSAKKVRTCPDCGLQFTKADGCNKMHCPDCGTSVCYVCRNKVSSYSHFCTHAQDPARAARGERGVKFCERCDKCPLWKDYDDR